MITTPSEGFIVGLFAGIVIDNIVKLILYQSRKETGKSVEINITTGDIYTPDLVGDLFENINKYIIKGEDDEDTEGDEDDEDGDDEDDVYDGEDYDDTEGDEDSEDECIDVVDHRESGTPSVGDDSSSRSKLTKEDIKKLMQGE